MKKGFLFLDEALPGIRWDAKYATWDNFTGKPVAGYEVNRVAGTCELAAALQKAKEKAAKHGFGLLLWDGYRPQRAVDSFLHWANLPEEEGTKQKYHPHIRRSDMVHQGYVAPKSGHSRGSSIDLTLFHLDTGNMLPMGGGFDYMDKLSHHGCAHVGRNEQKNRKFLCDLMSESGFVPYQFEWWHYTLANEPYPATYFDFPVAN